MIRYIALVLATLFVSATSLAAQEVAPPPSWDFGGEYSIPGVQLPPLDARAKARLSERPRIALVLANGSGYRNKALQKTERDARSMAVMLRHLGFEVYGKLNITMGEANGLVEGFRKVLATKTAPLVVFYYAGHGVQVEGESYLVPVDFPVHAGPQDLASAIKLADLLPKLKRDDGETIVVLDACRNNPYVLGMNIANGLAPMGAGARSLVVYATQPHKTAWEGDERSAHTLFTEHLLRRMSEPGRPLRDVLDVVSADVEKISGGWQKPDYSWRLAGDVSLWPQSCSAEEDDRLWQNALKSRARADFEGYRQACPTGSHVAEADAFVKIASVDPSLKRYKPGQVFHHRFFATVTGCDLSVDGWRIEWESSGQVLKEVAIRVREDNGDKDYAKWTKAWESVSDKHSGWVDVHPSSRRRRSRRRR